MNEDLKLDVVSFVNSRNRKGEPILRPILVKMFMFTFMVTLAMVLIYSDMKWAGYIIYGKEVVEFIIFICFMVKRRRNGTV